MGATNGTTSSGPGVSSSSNRSAVFIPVAPTAVAAAARALASLVSCPLAAIVVVITSFVTHEPLPSPDSDGRHNLFSALSLQSRLLSHSATSSASKSSSA